MKTKVKLDKKKLHSFIHDYNGPERDHASLSFMDTERKMNATFILSANTKKRHLSDVLAVVSGQRVFVWIYFFFNGSVSIQKQMKILNLLMWVEVISTGNWFSTHAAYSSTHIFM